MHILVVGKFYAEGFAEHIAETFAAMGHQVSRFQPGQSYSTKQGRIFTLIKKAQAVLHDIISRTAWYQQRTEQRLIEVVTAQKIDFTLVCHDFLTPRQVAQIKAKTKAPVALWFPDAISNFRSMMFLNAPYDALFFKEPFIVDILRNELQKPVYYLPECCNPNYHKPVAVTAEDHQKYGCDITTAGNLHTARVETFALLRDFDIKIWGHPAPQWMITDQITGMFQHRFVSNEEKSKCFLASKMVVNNLHPTEVFGTNVRTFEVAATGCFQLVSWRPGLNQLFRDGEEVVAFRSASDLREKIVYYLQHPEERARIATNGRIRTQREHTYEARLSLMLATIFQQAQGFPLPPITITC